VDRNESETLVTPRAEGGVRAEIGAWLDEFSDEVANLRFDDAATRFRPDVVSFSSFRDVVTGIDQFVNAQWRSVWPSIVDFRLETDKMHVNVSPDELMAAVACTWTSTGFDTDGTPFDRPGRCTVVLERDRPGDAWLGVQGHFSLHRGVPQQSFGPGGRRRDE
jgi:ketosteroid isomerase-like protein